MKNANTIIPCYAADTSGVCSALYELGGMTVVHDASGCNSTYSTHDEPRWYDIDSMIYISALTELDAIMGNDERIISDTVAAAADQRPGFIAICGSPMPMMTGVDFDAIANEIEQRSGIRTFGLHTNGTRSYIDGASQAFLAIVKEYVRECPKTNGIGINILGATPLDLPWKGTVDSLKSWISENGFEYVSCLAMGGTLDEATQAASASVNLVVSYAGMASAEYMYDTFGIPYVCGAPIGKGAAEQLAQTVRLAAERPGKYTLARESSAARAVVIGESVYASSISAAMKLDMNIDASVICPLPTDPLLLADGDKELYAEEDIKAALAEMQPELVVADPLYKYIIPKASRLIEIPHFAFSGRCFQSRMPDLINKDIKEIFR